ncbi:hypothetical protein [Streptomyces sp. NPDC018055]|uniref:hypothetical protein n=1 Tax=Streptomyces sp. NPDC018055 TaxID=3365038 RepID=UPI00378E55BB
MTDTTPTPADRPAVTTKPLLCTKCGEPVELAEDVIGYLDWGPAVVSDDGTVRLANPNWQPPVLMADNSRAIGRPRACCVNRACGHQWRLRRPFDPTVA